MHLTASQIAGSIIVKQIGHAILTVHPKGSTTTPETYLLTLPKLRIDGLWYGSPYIELADTSYVIGGGHITTIEYKGKGYFSGKSHSFKATTVPMPGQGGAGPKEIIVDGTWHETSKFVKGGAGSFYYAQGHKEEVLPLEWSTELGEYETRRLWFLVAKGIKEGDFDLASREKSRIENEQRQRRKDEQAAGTKWELKHFDPVESDPVCELLYFYVPSPPPLIPSLIDEQLGRVAKLNPATEDTYTFKGTWPSGFAAILAPPK